MSKTYMLKFKESICIKEREVILSKHKLHKIIESFGIYVLSVNDDDYFLYKDHEHILYIKPSA